jgi:hypothetical protein
MPHIQATLFKSYISEPVGGRGYSVGPNEPQAKVSVTSPYGDGWGEIEVAVRVSSSVAFCCLILGSRSLDACAKALYVEIAARYGGVGSNNRRIPYSAREAVKALKVGKTRAAIAFEHLRKGGFIVVETKGHSAARIDMPPNGA